MCTSGLFTFSAGLLRTFDNKATFMQNPDFTAKVHLRRDDGATPKNTFFQYLSPSCQSEGTVTTV